MKTEIKWALVLGIMTLLWFVLEQMTGFNDDFIEFHKTAGLLYLIPFALIYFLGLTQVKNLDNGGSLSLMEGVKSSAMIALYALPLIIIAAYIKIKFISPGFLENMSAWQITSGADENMVKRTFSTSGFLISSALYSLSGIVIGAIISFLIKTK